MCTLRPLDKSPGYQLGVHISDLKDSTVQKDSPVVLQLSCVPLGVLCIASLESAYWSALGGLLHATLSQPSSSFLHVLFDYSISEPSPVEYAGPVVKHTIRSVTTPLGTHKQAESCHTNPRP